MMKRIITQSASRRLSFCFFLIILCFHPIPQSRAEKLRSIPVSIHIHSNVSSGGRSIAEIAAIAKKQDVRVLILTDLYQEHYEYGLRPFRGIIKKSYERDSIMKFGPERYLQQILFAQKQNPQVEIIDGTAATPFYYWSGGLFSGGPLVLNNRAKDLLVLGLGNAKEYKKLPVLGNKNSGFDAYSGDAYSAPYQKFIDAARQAGGLVFWSHPHAYEHMALNNVLFNLNVYLETPPYEDSLLSTFRYTGFGVFSTELAQIAVPNHLSTASPGGTWDRVLQEYCAGKRQEPVWAIGETDYNGYPDGIKDLDAILNMVLAANPSRQSVLDAICRGRLYLMMAPNRSDRLILDEFTVADGPEGKSAGMGESVQLNDLPLVRIHAHSQGAVSQEIQVLIIRDGQIIHQQKEMLPFAIQYQDRDHRKSGKSYYRVIAYAERAPHRLITNPVFTERQ